MPLRYTASSKGYVTNWTSWQVWQSKDPSRESPQCSCGCHRGRSLPKCNQGSRSGTHCYSYFRMVLVPSMQKWSKNQNMKWRNEGCGNEAHMQRVLWCQVHFCSDLQGQEHGDVEMMDAELKHKCQELNGIRSIFAEIWRLNGTTHIWSGNYRRKC